MPDKYDERAREWIDADERGALASYFFPRDYGELAALLRSVVEDERARTLREYCICAREGLEPGEGWDCAKYPCRAGAELIAAIRARSTSEQGDR